MRPFMQPNDPLEAFLANVPDRWKTHGIDHTSCKVILEILYDNKLTLFPGYTDHGLRHVCEVLAWEDFLVSEAVRSQAVLSPADYAALIMATLLHDLAIHIQPAGFLQLIAGTTPHAPVEWFQRYRGDGEWSKEWQEFFAEARRFDDRALTRLFGGKVQVRTPPADISQWLEADYLLAGEFIRRHHARLAHEIALFGFPGIPQGIFPGLTPHLGEVADLVGVIARSHGTGMRDVIPYLKARHGSEATPHGIASTYLMAVLRVADYLQLQPSRAPAILLHLRSPLSPVSLEEWRKHGAVSHVGHHDTDRAAVHVQVSLNVPHRTLLQLQELFALLQAELDTSSAVLREIYGSHPIREYNVLELAKTRLTHNIDEPEFTSILPYVPVRAEFRSKGIDLLYQLVKPLYGYAIGLGVREMVQNAVDAVREMEALLEAKPHLRNQVYKDQGEFPGQVRVRIDIGANGEGTLEIEDRGVGMTPEIICDYFLTIGVSYRSSDEWEQLFLDEARVPRVFRSGRFGIGVLAAFLLGDTIEVTTRHFESERGVRFRASIPSDLIALHWVEGVPIGTSITISLDKEAARTLYPLVTSGKSGKNSTVELVDWYAMEWPSVMVEAGDHAFKSRHHLPAPGGVRPRWRSFGFEAYPEIQWSYSEPALVACNGILVKRKIPASSYVFETRAFGFPWPAVSIMDPSARLRLNLQRTDVHWDDGFPTALATQILYDMLAYALLRGPTSREDESIPGADPPKFDYPGVVPRSTRSFLQLEDGYALWDPEIVSVIGVERVIIATYHDSFAFFYPSLAPGTAYRSDGDGWADLMLRSPEAPGLHKHASQRVLNVLLAGGVLPQLRSVPGIYATSSLVVVKKEIRDQVVRDIAESADWSLHFSGVSIHEADLGGDWYLLKTRPSMEPSYDPVAAIAGVSEKSKGTAKIALTEIGIQRVVQVGLLGNLWRELIGPRPIPYDPQQRRAELAHAWEALAYYVEAWKHDLAERSGG